MQSAKFHFKTKNFTFEIKIALFGYFWTEFAEVQSFMQNKKTLNLEPKMLYLGTFRPELGKTIFIFEISSFEIVIMPSFM